MHAGARFVAQRLLLKPVIWRLATVTVLGTENLDKVSGPYVVVSNHSSHLDTPAVRERHPGPRSITTFE